MEQMQAKQAEMANNIDRLSSDVMQIKGLLDEKSHQSKTSQSDSDLIKSTLQKRSMNCPNNLSP